MHEKFSYILDFLNKNKEWIFSGIGISVIGLIFWFFKAKPSGPYQKIEGGNSNQQIGRDVKQIQKSGNNSINNQVLGNQTTIYGISGDQLPDIIKAVTEAILVQYPIAFQNAQRNTSQFSSELAPRLSSLTNEELQNLGDPDVVAVLMEAMKEAARTDEIEVHRVLSEAVSQRVKLGKSDIKKLTFNQAIETTLKLNTNLLQILSLLFFLIHVKILGNVTLTQYIEFIRSYFIHVKDVIITDSNIEHLQAVGCGSFQPFSNSNLGELVLSQYPHLFFHEFPSEELSALELRQEIKQILFPQVQGKISINSVMLFFIQNGFEGAIVEKLQPLIHIVNSISEDERNKIITFLKKYRMNNEETEQYIFDKIPEYRNLFDQLKKVKNIFRLTSLGRAIALSFWKSKNLELNVDIWIN